MGIWPITSTWRMTTALPIWRTGPGSEPTTGPAWPLMTCPICSAGCRRLPTARRPSEGFRSRPGRNLPKTWSRRDKPSSSDKSRETARHVGALGLQRGRGLLGWLGALHLIQHFDQHIFHFEALCQPLGQDGQFRQQLLEVFRIFRGGVKAVVEIEGGFGGELDSRIQAIHKFGAVFVDRPGLFQQLLVNLKMTGGNVIKQRLAELGQTFDDRLNLTEFLPVSQFAQADDQLLSFL